MDDRFQRSWVWRSRCVGQIRWPGRIYRITEDDGRVRLAGVKFECWLLSLDNIRASEEVLLLKLSRKDIVLLESQIPPTSVGQDDGRHSALREEALSILREIPRLSPHCLRLNPQLLGHTFPTIHLGSVLLSPTPKTRYLASSNAGSFFQGIPQELSNK